MQQPTTSLKIKDDDHREAILAFTIGTLVSWVEFCVQFLRDEYGGYQGADDESEGFLGGGCPGHRGVFMVAPFIGYKFEAMREGVERWAEKAKKE